MVKGEIEFEGGNIGGDWVIQNVTAIQPITLPWWWTIISWKSRTLSVGMTTLPIHLSVMVYEALGWEAPEFGHMTLIINSETGKNCPNVIPTLFSL